MEKTIEERANKAYPIYDEGYFDNDIKNACFHAYCKGATEQKAIDDAEWKEKCKWIDATLAEMLKKRDEQMDVVVDTIKAGVINKACEWLRETFPDCYIDDEEIEENFRKAMEM